MKTFLPSACFSVLWGTATTTGVRALFSSGCSRKHRPWSFVES